MYELAGVEMRVGEGTAAQWFVPDWCNLVVDGGP